jgi:hypothetical protein
MAERTFLTFIVDKAQMPHMNGESKLNHDRVYLQLGKQELERHFAANTIKVRSTSDTSDSLTFRFKQQSGKRAGPLQVSEFPFLDTTFFRDSVHNDET